MAVAHNIVIRPGVTFKKIFKWYTKDNVTLVKTPVDLTGYTAKMEIRENIGSTVLLTCTTENGRIAVNSSGEITVTINAATTTSYSTALAVYDILLVSPDGEVFEFVSGSVTLKQGVTA